MRKNKFGIQLKDFLDFNNININNFSKSTEISYGDLIKIFNGEIELTKELIYKISEYSSIPINYIKNVEENYSFDNLIDKYLVGENLTLKQYLNKINYKEIAKQYNIIFTDERNYYCILKDIIKVIC